MKTKSAESPWPRPTEQAKPVAGETVFMLTPHRVRSIVSSIGAWSGKDGRRSTTLYRDKHWSYNGVRNYIPHIHVYIYILVAQASIFSVYAIGTAYTRPSDLTSLNQLYRFVVGVCTTCITGVLMKQIHLASAPSLWWIEHHPSCLDAGKVIGITTVKASSTVNSSARGVEEGLLQSLRPNSSHIMSVCVSVIQPFCQHLSISSASTC